MIGLTSNTVWRYVHQGIRCNAIAASVDMTRMSPGGSQRAQAYFGLVSPELEAIDIAKLALFLVSAE